jgi:hypothetical protein
MRDGDGRLVLRPVSEVSVIERCRQALEMRTSSVIRVMASLQSKRASFRATGSGGMGSLRMLLSERFQSDVPSSTAKVNARSIPLSMEFCWHGELGSDTVLLVSCFRSLLVSIGEKFSADGVIGAFSFRALSLGLGRILYLAGFWSTRQMSVLQTRPSVRRHTFTNLLPRPLVYHQRIEEVRRVQ